MPYIKSIAYEPSAGVSGTGFPFTVPAIEALEDIDLSVPVTFFVGENGSGKSTLLEAIACALSCPTVGRADASRDPSLALQRLLARQLRVAKGVRPRTRLFFRAEDAIGFTRRVADTTAELEAMAKDYNTTLSGEGRQRAVGAMEGQIRALQQRYGDNPDAASHGEWFLNILRERIHPRGLYLLDEPETPLSPIHQLSLLSIIKHASEEDECQFVIATHSPILMALPGAQILSFDYLPVKQVSWNEVEHVDITRAFLNNPESFLQHL